jgi:hypothetical protein
MLSLLYTIAAIVVILWLFGFLFNVAGGFIHILLVVAVILVILELLRGRRTY